MTVASAIQQVDSTDPTPKYIQAREILVDAIRNGRLAPGTKLPSTKEISTLFNVSLITAHRALEGLVESGWLRREVGRGTFVRDDVDFATISNQAPFSIGLLLSERSRVNLDDYYHSSLINSLRRQAVNGSRRVEFFFRDRFDLRERQQGAVGALCIHPPMESQADVERLSRRSPVVVLGGTFVGSSVPCIDCDNELGGRQAIEHLLGLGHRRFALVSGPLNLTNSRDRTNGAYSALRDAGVTIDPDDVMVSADAVVLEDVIRARLEARLTGPDRPTAVFAGGFYLAMAVLQIVRRCGLSVPEQLSVVGFDDPQSAPLLDPPLTTVRQPLEAMAAAAYETICALVANSNGVHPSRKLPTELIVRGSTGPCRMLG